MAHVWVIEMKAGKLWEPCNAEGRLTRHEARVIKNAIWKKTCPDDKFRARKYVRAE